MKEKQNNNMKGNLKIDENTVVHCPTEELANEVLVMVLLHLSI